MEPTPSTPAALPPEVLALIAFYGVTRGTIPDAARELAFEPSGDVVLAAVRQAECASLAQLRRVCLAWCDAFSPLLFYLADFAPDDLLAPRPFPARHLAFLRVLLSQQDHSTDHSDSGVAPQTRQSRIPRVANLIRVLHVRGSPSRDFLDCLKSLVFPQLHSIHVQILSFHDVLDSLPRSPSITKLSLTTVDPNGYYYDDMEKFPCAPVLSYLQRLPGLVKLELGFCRDDTVVENAFETNGITLPRLSSLIVHDFGLLHKLVECKVFDPANLSWFSGNRLDKLDLVTLASRFSNLVHLGLNNTEYDEDGKKSKD